MSSGVFTIGINASNGSLLLTKQGTLVLDFSQTGPAAFNTRVTDGAKGDVTVTESGTHWVISDRAVTPSKLFAVGQYRLIGRWDSASGDAQEISVGGGLEFSSSAIRRSALIGDVTAPAGSNTTTITPTSNPSWITALAWVKITGAPTTLAGYGITDAAPLTHTHPSADISDSTTAGRALLTASDAAAQRSALELGTVATQNANNVSLTGGTIQGVGVATGSFTSNANEALLRSCRKASAGTITKGQVVYIIGSTGSHLTVELADADLEASSSKTFGVAVENITSSQEGYVMVEGLLTGLSNLPTSSFADGDSLWLSSTAGGWQSSPPANPAHGVYLGRVITASNGSAGKAYIRIQNGYELDELHDVVITTPADAHSLFYEASSGLWKNRRTTLSDISQSSASTGQFVEWNGSAWVAASITASDVSDSTSAGRALLTAADAAAQRSAMGLGGAALLNVGTTTGTVAAGDDARLSNARTPTAHQASHRLGGSDVITPLTQSMSDADATVSAGVTYVRTSASFTSPRTLTLPAASTVPAGLSIVVLDTFGAVNGANTLTIARAGSDTVNGATTAMIGSARGGRILTSDGVSAWTFDNGVLRTSQNLSDVPNAATARTNLGLGTAAVRADTDFIRDDVDQSNTAAQKRTARFNLGFADSFTTSQLLALTSAESARLRVAFCSDCLTSGATTTNLVGDICIWAADRWVTLHDRVQPTTDWLPFALEITRRGDRILLGPFLTVHGENGGTYVQIGGYVSGAGATIASTASNGAQLIQYNSGPGTTSTGSFKAVPVTSINAMTSAPARKMALVMSWFGSPSSVSNVGVDEWHWRFGFQTPVFNSSAALQVEDFGFAMDDRNTLGLGSSGGSLRALCRINGTTLDWIDTGISPSAGLAFLIATWEPNGPGARDGRVRVASANDFGATITTYVDRNVTFSGANQLFMPCLNGAKTLGTGARLVSRRFLQAVTLRTSVSSGGIIS